MPTRTVAELASILGKKFFDWQVDAFEHWTKEAPSRLLLYYRTGSGKSITSLSCLALRGYDSAVVIAPPSTSPEWEALGKQLGMTVEVISHAKFRMPDYKPSRFTPVIADEFHLFGGHNGQGWKKLEKLGRGLSAPLIMCSATPNYNDAERCYCVQRILDPDSVKGGFLQFLYQNCVTRQNPFSNTPIVEGFLNFASAADYLASLPNVLYLPDNVTATIVNVHVNNMVPDEFINYGYNRRTHRVMASQMEERHAAARVNLIGDDGFIREDVYEMLTQLVGESSTPVLIYANTETVAMAMYRSAVQRNVNVAIVSGANSKSAKNAIIQSFKKGEIEVLVGTATLATGTDGLDKMCDTMILLQDTDDQALRRQLVGRILPRGDSVDASNKRFYRITADL